MADGQTEQDSANTALPVVPGWLEQDPLLRQMWTEGKTPDDIATTLGRSVAAIMTRAARLGLPRRAAPGRKKGYRRSETPPREKKAKIKIRVPRTIEQEELDDAPSEEVKMRVCLMCLKKFPSQGRHNRICPNCKGTAEYATGSSTPDFTYQVSN